MPVLIWRTNVQAELETSGLHHANGAPNRQPRSNYPVSLIDLHSHILPGIDDGARTVEDSREMARVSAREGVTVIAATPHVRHDYPTTPDQVELAVASLNRDFADERIDVSVVHGAEIDLEWLGVLTDSELHRLSLAQTGRYVLVEIPLAGWPLYLERRIYELRSAEVTPLLAHPERNRDVQRNTALVAAAAQVGALIQVTAASLAGRLGREVRRTCERLLELNLVHVLASDAHAPTTTAAGLSAATASLHDDGLARFLTQEVPAAIVAGEDVPRSREVTRGRPRRLARWRR
jgi:protein-tyrosine phosphatase